MSREATYIKKISNSKTLTYGDMHLFTAVSWSDAFYKIRKKIITPIFAKIMIYFCTDTNISIKKKYIKQRSHKIMDLKHFLYVNGVF